VGYSCLKEKKPSLQTREEEVIMSEETNPQEDNSVLASFRQVLYPLAEADRLYEAGKPVDIAKVLQQAQ
jgi:hypothetical protein